MNTFKDIITSALCHLKTYKYHTFNNVSLRSIPIYVTTSQVKRVGILQLSGIQLDISSESYKYSYGWTGSSPKGRIPNICYFVANFIIVAMCAVFEMP